MILTPLCWFYCGFTSLHQMLQAIMCCSNWVASVGFYGASLLRVVCYYFLTTLYVVCQGDGAWEPKPKRGKLQRMTSSRKCHSKGRATSSSAGAGTGGDSTDRGQRHNAANDATTSGRDTSSTDQMEDVAEGDQANGVVDGPPSQSKVDVMSLDPQPQLCTVSDQQQQQQQQASIAQPARSSSEHAAAVVEEEHPVKEEAVSPGVRASRSRAAAAKRDVVAANSAGDQEAADPVTSLPKVTTKRSLNHKAAAPAPMQVDNEAAEDTEPVPKNEPCVLNHSSSADAIPTSPMSPAGGSPRAHRRKGIPQRARLDSEEIQPSRSSDSRGKKNASAAATMTNMTSDTNDKHSNTDTAGASVPLGWKGAWKAHKKAQAGRNGSTRDADVDDKQYGRCDKQLYATAAISEDDLEAAHTLVSSLGRGLHAETIETGSADGQGGNLHADVEAPLSPRSASRANGRKRGHNWSKPLRPPKPPTAPAYTSQRTSSSFSNGRRSSINGSYHAGSCDGFTANGHAGSVPNSLGITFPQHHRSSLNGTSLSTAGSYKSAALTSLLDAVGQLQICSNRPELQWPLSMNGAALSAWEPAKPVSRGPNAMSTSALLHCLPTLEAVERMAAMHAAQNGKAGAAAEMPLFM